MRKNNFFKSIILIMLFWTCCPLYGCSDKKEETNYSEEFYIYYPDKEYTGIQKVAYELQNESMEDRITECIEQLSKQTKDVDLRPAIGKDETVLSTNYNEGLLMIDFANTYYAKDKLEEILKRAAIVRTFLQFRNIKGVSFLVEGTALVDSKTQPVGIMTEDTFIYNAGTEINSYERTNLVLYFANKAGDMLVKTNEAVAYNSNISLEMLVCEQIINGPLSRGEYRCVNENTDIISVNSKDGVCYVNLSKEFLTKPGKIKDEVVLFSFVNSLTELPNINKVQFMIDGETEISFGDHSYLNSYFERNFDIVEEGNGY